MTEKVMRVEADSLGKIYQRRDGSLVWYRDYARLASRVEEASERECDWASLCDAVNTLCRENQIAEVEFEPWLLKKAVHSIHDKLRARVVELADRFCENHNNYVYEDTQGEPFCITCDLEKSLAERDRLQARVEELEGWQEEAFRDVIHAKAERDRLLEALEKLNAS